MKKSIAVLVLSLITATAATVAFAERPHDRESHRAEMKARMAEELQLTDAQQQSLDALRENHRAQMQAIRDQYQDRDERKAAKNALREQMDTDVAAILSTEQYAKFQEIKENRKQRRGKRKRKHRGEDQQLDQSQTG